MTVFTAPRQPAISTAASAWQNIPPDELSRIIHLALHEDLGRGDITTALTVDSSSRGTATIRTNEAGVISGVELARLIFVECDPALEFSALVSDGEEVEGRTEIIRCSGRAAAILSAERVALNFLQRMSGISTLTAKFVTATGHNRARILDTRKTAPGLRPLDKYAVVCGGGFNHRFGLDDGILIKDNHIAAAGGITQAIERAQARRPHGLKIEIEVDALDQIQEVLDAGAEIILLDNMHPDDLRQAVAAIDGRAISEASGGVTLSNVRSIADSGVDLISVGQLTHSLSVLDISLEIESQ